MPRSPHFLTVLTRHGGRDPMTCHYRCGDACSYPEPNTSGNEHIQAVIARSLSRRSLLRGTVGGAGALVLAGGVSAPAAARPRSVGTLAEHAFVPVDPNVLDDVVVPQGYTTDLVIRWGDPVLPGAPAFDVNAQTGESAAAQFGYNCDYVGVVPLPRCGGRRALLVTNHEFTNEELMFPEGYDVETVKRVGIESHGMSAVQVQRVGDPTSGRWKPVDPAASAYNRRITGSTEFRFDGPVAGDPLVQTSADPAGTSPRGTLNNCAGGMTPWGTVLSGEENFNFYFRVVIGEVPEPTQARYRRYGLGNNGPRTRNWHTVDPRFDAMQEPNEPNRFGWIVEVDPHDPTSVPRKHSMLGRFKHEGANIAVGPDGRVAAYMGDDERGEYMYKFVSAGTVVPGKGAAARAANRELFSTGTLYAARFTGDGTEDGQYDGTGEWAPLASDTESFVPGMSVSEVLVFTRMAADTVLATRMDRPEDVEPNPVNKKVYAALTNNQNRGQVANQPFHEANPLTSSSVRDTIDGPLLTATGNRNGYVLELTEDGDDPASETFSWLLFLVCGDPEAQEVYFGGYAGDDVSPNSCPDNVAFDSIGNLWFGTDGNALGSNDGIFRVPVQGPDRGRVSQFLTVPVGAEACGPLITDDDRTLWCAVQHPGEVTGSTFAAPASTWPHSDPFPRPSVVVAHRSRPR